MISRTERPALIAIIPLSALVRDCRMRRLIHGQLCLISEELVSRLGWWADASRIGGAGDGEQLAIEAQKACPSLGPSYKPVRTAVNTKRKVPRAGGSGVGGGAGGGGDGWGDTGGGGEELQVV